MALPSRMVSLNRRQHLKGSSIKNVDLKDSRMVETRTKVRVKVKARVRAKDAVTGTEDRESRSEYPRTFWT